MKRKPLSSIYQRLLSSTITMQGQTEPGISVLYRIVFQNLVYQQRHFKKSTIYLIYFQYSFIINFTGVLNVTSLLFCHQCFYSCFKVDLVVNSIVSTRFFIFIRHKRISLLKGTGCDVIFCKVIFSTNHSSTNLLIYFFELQHDI